MSIRHKKLIVILLSLTLIISVGCSGAQNPNKAQAASEPTPTLVLVGTTTEKPVPFGYDIMLWEFVLRVDEIIRSEHTTLTNPAGDSILEDGQEFLLIRLTNQCVKPGQDICQISPLDYQLMDSSGNPVFPETNLKGVEELFSNTEVASGASLKGMLAFRVDTNASYPILSYRQFDGSPIFFSLAY